MTPPRQVVSKRIVGPSSRRPGSGSRVEYVTHDAHDRGEADAEASQAATLRVGLASRYQRELDAARAEAVHAPCCLVACSHRTPEEAAALQARCDVRCAEALAGFRRDGGWPPASSPRSEESAAPGGAQVMPGQVLRDYQVDAIARVQQAFATGKRRVVLVMATGSGKSSVSAEIARRAAAKGKRVLFLAHRKELIDQASDRFRLFGVENGVIMGDDARTAPGLPIQVGSIQTVVRRDVGAFDLIIVDECHRVMGASYLGLLAEHPKAYVLGATATPWRQDGRGLGDLFEDVVVGATPGQLIAAGHLCGFGGFTFYSPDLADVAVQAGEYQTEQLAERMNKRPIIGDIVARWLERAGGVRTVCFAINVKHSQAIVAEFVAAGIAAEHVDGTTPKPQREAILDRLKHGATTVV